MGVVLGEEFWGWLVVARGGWGVEMGAEGGV